MNKNPKKSDDLFNDPIAKNIVVTQNGVRVNLTPEELYEQEIADGIDDLLKHVYVPYKDNEKAASAGA